MNAGHHVTVEATLDHRALFEVGFSSRQIAGDEPHVIMFTRPDATVPLGRLLPEGAEIVSSHRRTSDIVVHAVTVSGSIRLEASTNSTNIVITSSDASSCMELAREISRRFRTPPGDEIPIIVWNRAASFPNQRRIAATPWSSIRGHYPAPVAARLDELMTAPPPATGGRVVLFHGAPGTGKTHAVRALIHAWRSWCSMDLIAEPERVLTSAAAIERLLWLPREQRKQAEWLGESSAQRVDWQLLIAEDTDDLLCTRPDGGRNPGLGALLNYTDGITGQGGRAIFLLTTNEPLGEIPRALTRPGRCLACIEFERFDPDEARAWLGPSLADTVNGPMTLAELMERRSELAHSTAPSTIGRPIGGYL